MKGKMKGKGQINPKTKAKESQKDQKRKRATRKSRGQLNRQKESQQVTQNPKGLRKGKVYNTKEPATVFLRYVVTNSLLKVATAYLYKKYTYTDYENNHRTFKLYQLLKHVQI